MVLEILKHPHLILSQKCKEIGKITKDLTAFAKDLSDTLTESKGLGLAAPQVGRSIRMLVIKPKKKTILMINPVIIAKSNTKRGGQEGCLSFESSVEYNVKRPTWVKVRYKDLNGKVCMVKLEDLEARIFFHELNHLDGITMDLVGELV